MFERRTVIKGLAGVPLAAVLADASLARAAAAGLEPQSLSLPSGDTVSGALGLPQAAKAPAVLLIHEWWGLNDQIKAVAAELSQLGYLTLACDLMKGKVATTPEEAQGLTKSVDAKTATETVVGWIEWLRRHDRGTGKVGVVGWCFGGGWSLNASLATPVDATVIYYGVLDKTPAQLAALKGPVLGHFGTQDSFINPAMVERFKTAMAQAHKPADLYSYDANHAFANPTGQNYHRADAQLAWQRTLAFLKQNLA
ncbi:MAG: dienelactone hydrolase family protein [Azospirillaceae bacterium]|nr:dienelactone hydrolase family protein [Azospirillaceae bacterium]